MNERDPKLNGARAEDDEAEVRRLLERAGPRPPIPPEDLEAITATARASWRREVGRRDGERREVEQRGRASAVPLAMAAMLLLAVGLAWWWTARGGPAAVDVARVETAVGPVWVVAADDAAESGRRPLVPGAAIPAGAALITSGANDAAGRASLRLPDGTVVRLDAGSRVRFDSPAALALERGAVYADTGAGGSGLAVTTPAGIARDVGTRFTIRLAEPADSAVEVRVRDGAVVLERDGRDWLAEAGEELVVDAEGSPQRRPIDPYGPGWEWVLEAAAGYPIEGRTLGDFLDWVSRETGRRVRWTDQALEASAREIVLRGGIGDLRPDQAALAVLPGAGLEGELVDGEADRRDLVIHRRD